MAASVGSQAKLGVGTTSTVDQPLEFLSESLRATKTILDTAGIRGTRSHVSERTRGGPTTVSGSISMNPSPAELNDLLEYIMGGTPTVGTPAGKTTFPLGETLPAAFFISVDRIAKVFTYSLCKIVRATFRASEGSLLELSIDIEGGSETVGNAGTFPSLTLPTDAPFVFHDAVLTMQAGTRAIKDFELVIENISDTTRFMNSQTRAEIPTIDRMVTLRCTTAYTSAETALYDQAIAGAAADLTLTNGNLSLQFSIPGVLQIPAVSPIVSSKGEILLAMEGVARMAGANRELSAILDLTP